MIRHVLTARFVDDVDPSDLEEFIAAVRSVSVPGMRALRCGTDLGVLEGNWDYAVVADFDDVEAYRAYDRAPEHLRIRAELAPRVIAEVSRVQFEVP